MRQERHISIRQQTKHRHRPRSLMRRVLGWIAIGVGLLGIVLPVLPGVIFIALGIVLLGPHDPTLRRIAILIRLILRRWSCAKQHHIRRLGQYVRSQYRQQRLLLRAQLHHHERGEQSWRGHYVLLALTLFALAITAGIGLVVWHTIL
jgi:uncharacterized membrane protein YbaN (DUF454 family)